MNRCTEVDDILHERVPRQPLQPIKFQGHRLKVKVVFS